MRKRIGGVLYDTMRDARNGRFGNFPDRDATLYRTRRGNPYWYTGDDILPEAAEVAQALIAEHYSAEEAEEWMKR